MEPPSKPLASIPDAQSEPPSHSQRLGFGGLLVVALGSLLAVPGVLFDALTSGVGLVGPVVVGPLVEEVLKPTGLVILLTRRPHLKLSPTTGVLAGAFSGLVFAAIENVIYLLVYVPEHNLLHEPRERSGIFQGTSLTCLVIAAVLHGAYNFAAILLQLGHYTIEK